MASTLASATAAMSRHPADDIRFVGRVDIEARFLPLAVLEYATGSPAPLFAVAGADMEDGFEVSGFGLFGFDDGRGRSGIFELAGEADHVHQR